MKSPDPIIYDFAAKKFGLVPQSCVYVSHDASEDLGALNAGMKFYSKLNPPGSDFSGNSGNQDRSVSGRQWTRVSGLLEHEHLLGERIFACGEKIASWIDS